MKRRGDIQPLEVRQGADQGLIGTLVKLQRSIQILEWKSKVYIAIS